MFDIWTDCKLIELSENNLMTGFDCGDSDLNDFFNHDALLFRKQFLGQTFFFRRNGTQKIVCAFSLSADSIKTFLLPSGRRGKVKQLIPHEKSLQSYPAFLIGRLGVSIDFGGHGVGTQMLKYIINFSIENYPYFGRFLTVDAYNKPEVLKFYQKGGFALLFATEEQESENLKKATNTDEPLRTRQMFFDLKRYE